MRSDLLRDIDEHSVSTDASACNSYDSDALYDSDGDAYAYAYDSDGIDAENEEDDAENEL